MAEDIQDEPIVDIQEAYTKTEQFIEDNKQTLTIVVVAVVAIVGIFIGWKYWYVAGQEKEAQKELFVAENYLGISYLKKGDFEKALGHLKSFSSNDQMVGPLATGAIGDCYVEMNKVEEGISYYLKAAQKSTNKFTSPMFLKKAGLAYESLSNYKDAVRVYERIKNDFPKSTEGQDIEKFLTRAKALSGE